MSTFLDKTEMKFVNIIKIIVLILSFGLIVGTIGLFYIESDSQYHIILFPLILGACGLLNVYRLNKTIKANNGTINSFHVKHHLLEIGRSALISLTYLCAVTSHTKYAIMFGVLTLFVIGVQILNYRWEVKKEKANEQN